MKQATLIAFALTLVPMASLALPALGDLIGTNATDATAALNAAGCETVDFETEGGKIEARCTDTATGVLWEIVIDPATGLVVGLKQGD